MKLPKFNQAVCETCQHYWSYPNTTPSCHFKGKKIYEGMCIEYVPNDQELSKHDQMVADYEEYQELWN